MLSEAAARFLRKVSYVTLKIFLHVPYELTTYITIQLNESF